MRAGRSAWIAGLAIVAAVMLAGILPTDAASRFWVGGTGTWDNASTTHWSGSSGGANGASVPGVADTVTLDGSSGGGTVTVNGDINVTGITMSTFTGTLDFSANNNNVTITGAAGLTNSGTSTRTLNLGNGIWTMSSTGTIWNFTTVTGLTFNANSSVVNFTAVSSSSRTIAGGGLTYNTFSIAANSAGGGVTISGSNTFLNLNVAGQNSIVLTQGTTNIITNAFTWSGAAGAAIGLTSSSASNPSTISVATGSPTMSWAALRDITFTGGATFTATSSIDMGRNTGITITPPSGSGGGFIIGGS